MTKDPFNISAGEPVTVGGRPAFAMDRRRFPLTPFEGGAAAVTPPTERFRPNFRPYTRCL